MPVRSRSQSAVAAAASVTPISGISTGQTPRTIAIAEIPTQHAQRNPISSRLNRSRSAFSVWPVSSVGSDWNCAFKGKPLRMGLTFQNGERFDHLPILHLNELDRKGAGEVTHDAADDLADSEHRSNRRRDVRGYR